VVQTDEQLARQLWAIGDEVRMRLLRLLPSSEDCDHGNNVSRLAEQLGLAQPTVSHHLRVLRQAGLVKNRKMCRDVFYWIDPAAAEAVTTHLREVLLSPPAETED
jgi:ArsR family transcriptional regulator, arsenate/arsenite/antimonite-responsive transcriptional repressor